jgi:hypothetical protein
MTEIRFGRSPRGRTSFPGRINAIAMDMGMRMSPVKITDR